MEKVKSELRQKLEQLEDDIHKSWLKDLDKVKELKELIEILEQILEKDSIEASFENDAETFEYFIKKFSKETISNILRQHFIYGENGDDVALEVLVLYLKIFLKFLEKPQYIPLWDSVKEIFDTNKSYYKAMMYGTARIDLERKNKKQMSGEYYNVSFKKII
jgi:hypothetical protein